MLDFGEGFSIDLSFDASMFDKAFRENWLASDANVITLFLVEASTRVLEAMRMIAVGFADEFRAICARHVGKNDIERQVRLIHTAFSTRERMEYAWLRARSQGHSMNQDVKFFSQSFSIADKGGELDIFGMVFDARNS